MQATSSFSGTSNSLISSGYSESVDLDLVDEIIERSPRSATAFPVVYKSYVSALQDNGISPGDDTAYYQFLLKLQVIRAGTWGEKWDLWRATHIDPLQPTRVTPKNLNVSRLADVRSRVPFLDGASSDLDDAFAEGETSYSADGESVAESEPSVHRPTPRRSGTFITLRPNRTQSESDDSRSLVGYTPDLSLDFSPLGLDLRPVRTSTPISAQYHTPHKYDAGVAITPPPYSASVAHYDLTEDDSLLIQGLTTPKARKRELEEDRILEEEVLREMERRADQFYKTGLMGRCFDVWAQANDWVQKTTRQIDTVRANILLRQYLHKWRIEKDRVLSLPNTADRYRKLHLQASAFSTWSRRYKDAELDRREKALVAGRTRNSQHRAWTKWRAELTRRRTERWEKDMRSREKRFVRARETVLVQDVLDRWRGETRTKIDPRLAISFDSGRLIRYTFDGWHYRLEQKERLEGQLAVFERTRDKRLLAGVWGRWVQRGKLGRAEGEWMDRSERRMKKESLDRWSLLATQAAEANNFARRSALLGALFRWKTSFSDVRKLDRQAMIFRQVGEKALVRQAMSRWIVGEREVLLVRVLDQRMIKNVFEGWRNRLDSVRKLDDRLMPIHQAKSHTLLKSSIQTWRMSLSNRQAKLARAGEIHDANCLASTFAHWRKASSKVKIDQEVAEKARAFFVLRQVFGVWKVQRERKRQERWAESRKVELLRGVFTEWRLETLRSIEGKKLADKFRHQSDQRMLNEALSAWTNRVIFLKSRQLDISENRDTQLLTSTLGRWIRTTKKVNDGKALADSFMIVKGEETLREILDIWRDRTSRKRALREAKVMMDKKREERIIRGAWEVWVDRAVERRLGDIEEEVGIRHEDAILFRVWDKWKAKATLLPAITFDNHRVKQKAWISLIRAMDRAKAMKEFEGPRDRRLLEDVLAVWREKTQIKAVARAGRLRGRHRIPSNPPNIPRPNHRIHSLRSPNIPYAPTPVSAYPSHPRSSRPSYLPQPATRHIRSASTSNQKYDRGRVTPPGPEEEEGERMETQSVFSEPAYSRLRSELVRPRSQRGTSEEGDEREAERAARKGRSEVINAIKGGLGR